ncbi:hypothetical protein ACI6QG_14555 [Roseococcus sp. DSY-14]|uniref:hypothetical protein n=1 Tax=Roseococcus sp. DSY-14 TaxID=3369650 RepID=UPI00387AB7EA
MPHPLFWTRALAALSGAALVWGGLEYLAQVPPPGSPAVACAADNRAALSEVARLAAGLELRRALGALGGFGACPVASPLTWTLLVLGGTGLVVSLLVDMVLARMARLEAALGLAGRERAALGARAAALEAALAGREPPPAPPGDVTPRMARLEALLADREAATTRALSRLARLEEAMAARAAEGAPAPPSAAAAIQAAPPPPDAPPPLPEDHPLVLQVAEEMRAQGLNISPEVAQHVAALRLPRS